MIVYNPINWKNRAVEHKHRYEMSQAESAGLVYLTPAPGEVDEPGTPINADNLNHMDEAILAHDQKLDELEQKKVNISGGDISDTVATLDETVGDAADNIASGESLRTILSKIHKVITVLIWVLLFILGIEVGGNEQIIKGLHTIGLEAVILTIGGTLGSVIAAWALWRALYKRKGGQA